MNDFKKLKQFKPIPDYLTIKKSDIHGLGLFATEEIKEGVELGISHVKDDRFLHGYIRTSLGGCIRGSRNPKRFSCRA